MCDLFRVWLRQAKIVHIPSYKHEQCNDRIDERPWLLDY